MLRYKKHVNRYLRRSRHVRIMALSQVLEEAAGPWTWGHCVAWCACLLCCYAGTKLYCLVTEAMFAKILAMVALDSAAAGISATISNCLSDALTTVPTEPHAVTMHDFM